MNLGCLTRPIPSLKQKHGCVRYGPAGSRGRRSCPPIAVWGSSPGNTQKDATAELLERAFTLALAARLKQHGGIDVDVRSTAWGLLEGKFGGMTVKGTRWRTPLELTAEQLMVDFGELVLDTNKLMWQQTVALKNIPQGSVSFTLSSQDLANFVVHPIMLEAAAKAVKGHTFRFDRSTARIQLDPTTGAGIISYEGVWAGNGQRYAVRMMTMPAANSQGQAQLQQQQQQQQRLGAAGVRPAAAAAPGARGAAAATAGRPAGNSAVESLRVWAKKVVPPAARSGTGSYASMGSTDVDERQPPLAAAAAGAKVQQAAVGAAAAAATAAAPAPAGSGYRLPTGSAASSDGDLYGMSYDDDDDGSARVVAEGLQAFFSTLVINLQGIELRQPTLAVLPLGSLAGSPARGAAVRPAAAAAAGGGGGPVPALLRITMMSSILQLPPLNMKF